MSGEYVVICDTCQQLIRGLDQLEANRVETEHRQGTCGSSDGVERIHLVKSVSFDEFVKLNPPYAVVMIFGDIS